ncbi:glucose transporter rco-3 like protein [Verticillium longisporum]|uniref:Glucose transporter rco-3 like protein n=1 Tax=Verticillium longisporum TaxID=100787 RepID=A0A8I2ZP54_VERLO|nr:glucose transporter rco-3 like protein [Verticillium longisporum]KAG7133770.1 glucose transporter rco-3 like protein [Verticillium longisporum]KAG7148713.1 glucose transporter rco-3 like protein [Verticillium longisporum]
MAARVLNYIYVGMELAVIPVYQSEIIPTPIRGFAVGSYQFSMMCGGLIMNCICRGTSTLSTNAAWKIPLGLFFIVPTIVMSTVWFIPESPRWLLTKGEVGKAHGELVRLRSGTLSPEEIESEFAGLQLALQMEKEQGRYVEIFQGINRKRTAIIVALNFLQQATGQAFVGSYGAIFVRSIGTVNPFNMTIINASVNLLMCGISLFLNDRVGRRPLLMAGAAWQAVAIITMGGLGTIKNPSVAVKKATVAMLPLSGGGFCLGWAPLVYVVTTEVTSLHLRDASQRTAAIVNVVTAFAVNFSIPYLLFDPANLGSRLGFIFGAVAVVSVCFTWLFVPECKGKSLEQIDLMFNRGVPLRRFGSYKSVDVEFVEVEAKHDD